MIGRGSRVLGEKRDFTVIDLGNNVARFGLWEANINWNHIFRNPDMHLNSIRTDEEIQRQFKYKMPAAIRERFAKSENIDFDIVEAYEQSVKRAERPKVVIDLSVDQHVQMCVENAEDLWDAKDLAKLLEDEIEYRARKYSHCLAKSTKSYVSWLQDEYKRKLNVRLIQEFQVLS